MDQRCHGKVTLPRPKEMLAILKCPPGIAESSVRDAIGQESTLELTLVPGIDVKIRLTSIEKSRGAVTTAY
jgi:hypothetical protein